MENRAQKFSVRSAYKVAVRLKNQPKAEHSAARLHAWTWKEIWSLNVPPKIRTFIWRACSNCLPTRDNLHRRRVRVEPTCELCKQEPETTTHILWTCPFARNVWALIKGKIQKCSNGDSDFFLLFKQMQTKLSKQELETWAVTASALWNARNKVYFEQFQPQPHIIWEGARVLLEEYQSFMEAQRIA
uniref:Reverse transcriptase zinc-binding domain-containing protein n=1 Tax=Quercus lobata TaxID=97700 RepID=A0A7N2LAI0_QUELO